MHKDVWYYVDRQGKQRGPVTRVALADAVNEEAVIASSLVWRDGMPQWQPLSSLMGELQDLLGPATPPAPPPPSFAAPPPQIARHDDSVVYAGFIRRGAAVLLDWLILAIATFVLVFVLTLVAVIARGGEQPGDGYRLMSYAVSLALSLLYFALQESSVHQATPGKRALGIKVTDYQGQRISLGKAVGRWFATTLSYLPLMFGYFMAAFTRRKQALHDIAAGTLVVDQWAFTDQPEKQQQKTSAGLTVLVVLVCMIFPLSILAAIAIPAYQDYVVRAHVAQAITTANPIKALVAKGYVTGKACPSNGEAAIAAASSYAAGPVSSIQVGGIDEGERCALEITLNMPQIAAVHGKLIWLEMDTSSKLTDGQHAWRCSSNLPNKFLPTMCRAPSSS